MQDFTDDSYDPDHVAHSDMLNQENNDLALKSSFAGASSPANPTNGMFWLDTSAGILKIYNSGWVNFFDYVNERVYNLYRQIIAGTGLTGGGYLTADRTLSHLAHTGDVTGATALSIANNIITPAKTSHGFVAALSIPAEMSDEFSHTGDTTYTTVLTTRVLMPSGPTGISGSARLKCVAGGTAYCRIGIGSNYSGDATRAFNTYGWADIASASDFSGLTPGTIYSLVVQLKPSAPGYTAWLQGISLWWE